MTETVTYKIKSCDPLSIGITYSTDGRWHWNAYYEDSGHDQEETSEEGDGGTECRSSLKQ